MPQVKKKTQYICPGCFFLGTATLVTLEKNIFRCEECKYQLNLAKDPEQVSFYRTFAVHSKVGYRCPYCKRFIPHPLDNANTVSCPYFDCTFFGEFKELNKMRHTTSQKMRHTTSQTNPEKLVLDVTNDGNCFCKDHIVADNVNVQTALEDKQGLQNKIKIINEVILSQISHVSYTGSDFTIKHKQLVYQAFANILQKQPQEMVRYLLDGSRSGGFQHKVFQEYIRLLEESLPFFIKKGKKRYRIDSLLNDHLPIFDGISIFRGKVTDKLDIRNGTTEFYIGSRKGSYVEPYYIGKLLNLIHSETKEPLLHLVKEYSFHRIKICDIEPGTPVIVTHLRIPPHYQMGGMVYVNRIRKKIVEQLQNL
jgi:hypothetical protein